MEKDLKILKSKSLADGSKYFSLFEKHIPVLNAGSNVYLYMLGNLPCICEIIQKNPTSKYFICDADEVINAVQIMMDGCDISKTVDVYDIDMKFDCVIMNPPYQKNLHLKILAEAIKHLKDDNSKVVNLSPSPYTNYKNTNKFNLVPISYDKIDVNEASSLFNIQLQDMLLISSWCINRHMDINIIKNDFIPKGFEIVKKIKTGKTFNDFNVLNYTNELFFVPLKLMTARWDKNKNIIIDKIGIISSGKTDDGKPYKESRTRNIDRPCGGIAFNSYNEALNFKNSCLTTFFKFLVNILHTNSRYVLKDYPWMGDSINPRTGLKGYESEWTDEDFYRFFNITDDEKKIIEDTMAK